VERRRRVGELGALGAIAQRREPSIGRKPVATAAQFNGVRDERAICAAERATSRRGQGRPEARGAVQIARWSLRGSERESGDLSFAMAS
jgi:hypothetical protein